MQLRLSAPTNQKVGSGSGAASKLAAPDETLLLEKNYKKSDPDPYKMNMMRNPDTHIPHICMYGFFYAYCFQKVLLCLCIYEWFLNFSNNAMFDLHMKGLYGLISIILVSRKFMEM